MRSMTGSSDAAPWASGLDSAPGEAALRNESAGLGMAEPASRKADAGIRAPEIREAIGQSEIGVRNLRCEHPFVP